MKTLLFAIALCAAGCKDKAADQAPPAPQPTPPRPPTPPPAVADAAAPPDAPQRAIPNEPPVEVAGVPKACGDYEAAIERLATCTKLDVNTRATLRHAYNETASTWKAMSAADKAKLTKTCTDKLAEVDKVAKKPCGW